LLLWWKDRTLFWWLSPVLAGWVLSIPLSVWTSKVWLGHWARKRGLFLTPEEVWPTLILKRFHQALEDALKRPWATTQAGFHQVLKDPQIRSVHLSLLPPANEPEDPLAKNRLEGLRLKALSLGESSLLPNEKRELLWDAASIESLSRDFGKSVAARTNPREQS
jgi:membrane glycosyltransferase